MQDIYQEKVSIAIGGKIHTAAIASIESKGKRPFFHNGMKCKIVGAELDELPGQILLTIEA